MMRGKSPPSEHVLKKNQVEQLFGFTSILKVFVYDLFKPYKNMNIINHIQNF